MSANTLSLRCFFLTLLACQSTASQILKTTSFTTCESDSSVSLTRANVEYDNDNKMVTFDVAGTASESIKVMASLDVTAYGVSVYSNSFNPCDNSTLIDELCPVPSGAFAAAGTESVPSTYANQIPAIAFSVPDIAAEATLKLTAVDGGAAVACVVLQITNGKTANVAAISYASAAIAGAALVLGGATSLISVLGSSAAGGVGGTGTTSPGLGQVMTWFSGLAMNGMMSVSYPPVYRAFTKNFAFATGIIPWTSMQTSIDSFRQITGGNLTEANTAYLQNATLEFPDGSTTTVGKRSFTILARDIATSVNSTTSTNSTDTSLVDEIKIKVSGISAYIEDLAVPHENTFMTALLIISIVIAVIVVSILLVKVVLEVWALFGSFPKGLTGFRKHYWGTMARTITQLVLVLYGTLMLYSIYQFVGGDSWAAKLLAAMVIVVCTSVLLGFTFAIWRMARKAKATDGDVSILYNDKDIWLKYSIFYDGYKKDFWWTFVPVIAYMFAKGACLAIGDGHGMAQTIAQIVIEVLMLIFLIFVRPHERKSGNVVGIMIQVVRAMSVIIILVFVEELAIPQTAQTVAGVALIAVQSAMTGLLAILIVVNAIIVCCNENPHRKRRKAAEKAAALDAEMNLTPLHADNSLLRRMGSERGSVGSGRGYKDVKGGWASDEYDRDADARDGMSVQYPLLKTNSSTSVLEGANPYNAFPPSVQGIGLQRNDGLDESRQGLVGNAARPGNGGFRGGP